MKFLLFAGSILNFDTIESIDRYTDKSKIKKEYNEEKQEVSTKVDGDPYSIVVTMCSGRTYTLGYKSELDRDSRFSNLSKSLGAED